MHNASNSAEPLTQWQLSSLFTPSTLMDNVHYSSSPQQLVFIVNYAEANIMIDVCAGRLS